MGGFLGSEAILCDTSWWRQDTVHRSKPTGRTTLRTAPDGPKDSS